MNDRRCQTAPAGDHDAFRDLPVAMRHTSARPQDVYNLTWTMVDWESKMWVLAEHKGSRTARDPKPRVIGMSPEVEAVLRRRAEQHGRTGHVFLNVDDRPWTKNALGLRMRRLRVAAPPAEQVKASGTLNGEMVRLLHEYPPLQNAVEALLEQYGGLPRFWPGMTPGLLHLRSGPRAAVLYQHAIRLRDGGSPVPT
ncbi:hypothetical protein J0H58_36380 [bacterium]|nr:hypothetical protein [bacterium]